MATLARTFQLWVKRASNMELGAALNAIKEEIESRTDTERKHRAEYGKFSLHHKPIEHGPDTPHQHAE